jgi:hypothetical protein
MMAKLAWSYLQYGAIHRGLRRLLPVSMTLKQLNV